MSKRSKYTVEEKYDILVNYDNGVGSIEEICIKYKISTSTFYQWRYKCEKHGMDGLKKFDEKKNKETIEKVNKAIDKLKSSKNKKINFKTVSEEADVSKATLYNNDILKERILSIRVIKKGTSGIVVAHKIR